MQWHEVVFSQKPLYRLLRHLLFWVAWWLYFSVSFYFYQQPFQGVFVTLGSYLFIKTFLLVAVAAVASYTFIYFLLPWFINGKWIKASAGILLLGSMQYAVGYFLYWSIFPFVDSLFGPYTPNHFPTHFWPAVSLGCIEPLKVVAAAAIIKYAKYWWLKQKESERLEMEKINTELQLLKAQIHPNFLFTALNNIYFYSLRASPQAPEMLLKLSDLLSYMLYECNEPLVPLEREIEMMKDYMLLEKIRLDNAIDMELSVRGDMTGKKMAPFLLLPFIENCFKQSNTQDEQPWINMDINIEDTMFTMKLANGIKPDDTAPKTFQEGILSNARKRLNLLYPQQHELKLTCEKEMLMVLLKIDLTETPVTPSIPNEDVLDGTQTQPQSKLYAVH